MPDWGMWNMSEATRSKRLVYTSNEASEILGVCSKTISRMVNDGRLPRIRGMGNIRIPVDSLFKRCSGYKGHHECVDEYPDHMVPVSEFCSDRCSKDNLHHLCHKCMRYRNKIHSHTRIKHPLTGENKDDWKRRMAQRAGGVIGTPEWKSYLEKADAEWGEEVKGHLLNTAPAQEYFDWVDAQKESVVKQRVVSVKSRNYSEYAKLKELYNYTCQVEGCYETEVQFAHILKHSLDNSVDNHTNGWCICCNHHNAYDSNRMIVDVDGNFVRYNLHGDKVEEGRIIYHDRHEVDPRFIVLAREWHDNTKK